MWAPGGGGPGNGTGGWNEWSLNPSHYANLPHEQVDWAALAQQWIQMKTGNPEDSILNSAPHHHQQPQFNLPPPQIHHPPPSHQPPQTPPPQILPQQQLQPQRPLLLQPHSHHQPLLHHHHHRPPPSFWPEHQPSERLLPPPPPLNPVESEPRHGHGHGYSDHNIFSSPQNSHSPRVSAPQGNFHQNIRAPPPQWREDKYYSSHSETVDYTEDDSQAELEAARRRSLPAWIREGLEKVDREKKKQEEKERAALEREARQPEQTSSPLTSKWKSISNRDEESDEETVPPSYLESNKGTAMQRPPRNTASEQDIRVFLSSMSEEDRLELVMVTVRRQLTQILLEVTNDEIEFIAQECLNRVKHKVNSASQVRRTSSALGSLTTGSLGLADYGSDSDPAASDNEGPSHSETSSDDDSEAELIAAMERKKQLFKLRELEMSSGHRRSSSKSRSANPSKSRSVSRSGSEAQEDVLQTQKGDEKVSEKALLSTDSAGSVNGRNLETNPTSHGDTEKQTSQPKPSSHEGRSRTKSKEHSRERSRSTDKIRRRSRSPSNSRKNRSSRRGSDRTKSRSRSVSKRRRSTSRSRRDRSPRRSRSRSNESSRDRNRNGRSDRRRKRSRSKSSERKSHRSSRHRRSTSGSSSSRRSRSPTRKGKSRKRKSHSRESSRSRSIRRRTRSSSRSKSNDRKNPKSSRRKDRSLSKSKRKRDISKSSDHDRRSSKGKKTSKRSKSKERSRKSKERTKGK